MKLTIPKATRPTMQDYGIKDDSTGLLTWDWVIERLEKSENYWIASSRPNGKPHVAPVWGILLDDVVYFGTGTSSRKARNINHDSSVVLHLESGIETVIIEGQAIQVTNKADFERIAPIYAKKYAPKGYEPTAKELAEGLMYYVKPDIAMAWNERDFPTTATRWVFAS